ncbi:hypothetical protein ACHAWO_009531 [Cyclotella atomus]|uniref:Uncharacterized protein n=1 Tax=Cyclotella atomus TaxID=382360 RepID=A0ABD3PH02_9STRA
MGSNEQPVVQTIIESFTRCFHPSDFSCNHVNAARSKSPKHVRKSSKMSSSSSPTPAASRLELNGKEWDDVFDRKSRSTDSRRRRSSSRASKDVDHADVVAKAKKASQLLDPEAIEQRSLKRKLEIFRTRSSDVSKPYQTRRQPRSPTPEELVLSDSSEEEIANLTSSRKRFACGLGQHENGPMASIAKFFNLRPQPNPFGICFATPVRTASAEAAEKFTDDQLTTEEFISRHAHDPTITPELQISQDTSDLSRLGEDDTVTSTLYFDQKYAHVIQTRPPMPLFHSQAVPCDDYRGDDLTRIIKKKHLGQRSPARVKPSPPRPSPSPKKKYSLHDSPPSPMQVSDKSASVSSSPGAGPSQAPFRARDPDILHNTAAEI